MVRTLTAREARPWWLVFLSKYRYQVLVLVIIFILLMGMGLAHNPVELEGVYML